MLIFSKHQSPLPIFCCIFIIFRESSIEIFGDIFEMRTVFDKLGGKSQGMCFFYLLEIHKGIPKIKLLSVFQTLIFLLDKTFPRKINLEKSRIETIFNLLWTEYINIYIKIKLKTKKIDSKISFIRRKFFLLKRLKSCLYFFNARNSLKTLLKF